MKLERKGSLRSNKVQNQPQQQQKQQQRKHQKGAVIMNEGNRGQENAAENLKAGGETYFSNVVASAAMLKTE
jgi:hypothetical protein